MYKFFDPTFYTGKECLKVVAKRGTPAMQGQSF